MSRTVLITGAGGNIGAKLRAHFTGLGWTLRAAVRRVVLWCVRDRAGVAG